MSVSGVLVTRGAHNGDALRDILKMYASPLSLPAALLDLASPKRLRAGGRAILNSLYFFQVQLQII